MTTIADRLRSKTFPMAKPSGVSSPAPTNTGSTTPQDPSARIRSAIDRAKQQIAKPYQPPTGGPTIAGQQFLPQIQQGWQNTVQPAVVASYPNSAIAQMGVAQPPVVVTPDRATVLAWIQNQPAFKWLQTVLQKYGLDYSHLGPLPPQPLPGSTGGTQDSSSLGTENWITGMGSVGNPAPPQTIASNSDLIPGTQTAYSSQETANPYWSQGLVQY